MGAELPSEAGAEYPGQVKDFITEAEKVTARGSRSMVTVLTKKMAEDLAQFLVEKQIRAKYIHSDIKTIERIEILTSFRRGEFDVLVGVNLFVKASIFLKSSSLEFLMQIKKDFCAVRHHSFKQLAAPRAMSTVALFCMPII